MQEPIPATTRLLRGKRIRAKRYEGKMVAWPRGPLYPSLHKGHVGSAPPSNPVRFVVVRGTLTAAGHHGHLGAYSRELTPQEFLECRELSPDEHADF